MINYVDKMADALVDVLKYSNQDVEWVEPDDMKPNDGVQPEWFYPAIENAEYSEITAILQYTQQEAVFEDEKSIYPYGRQRNHRHSWRSACSQR